RSQRGVDRDATKLAADEAQRHRSGFRVGARQKRAAEEVLERERELVSGYAELRYCGFVTVTGSTHDTLERDCAEHEQVAARVGMELRPLDGQHDLGLGASLPVGRYPARRAW